MKIENSFFLHGWNYQIDISYLGDAVDKAALIEFE
jgi:hypothetical protein